MAQAAADALHARGAAPPLAAPDARAPAPVDPRSHALLAECLKLVYVAVTRSRRRLVIFDRDVRQRSAMYSFLGAAVVGGAAGAGCDAQAPVAELCGAVRGPPPAGRTDQGGDGVRQAAGLAQVRRPIRGPRLRTPLCLLARGASCARVVAEKRTLSSVTSMGGHYWPVADAHCC